MKHFFPGLYNYIITLFWNRWKYLHYIIRPIIGSRRKGIIRL